LELKNFINPHSTIKNPTNAFKENKIRNKGIDILAQAKNQTPVAIAAIAKAKIFRLSS
jgi:hypothetical protein